MDKQLYYPFLEGIRNITLLIWIVAQWTNSCTIHSWKEFDQLSVSMLALVLVAIGSSRATVPSGGECGSQPAGQGQQQPQVEGGQQTVVGQQRPGQRVRQRRAQHAVHIDLSDQSDWL